MGWRALNASSAAPSLPPTPIQFSGAHSRKSNDPEGESCSAPSRARRSPRPALASARLIASIAAALALAALAFGFHLGRVCGRLLVVAAALAFTALAFAALALGVGLGT